MITTGLLMLPAPAGAASATVSLCVAPMGMAVPASFTAQTDLVWVVDPCTSPLDVNEAPGVAGCALAVTDQGGDGSVDGGDVLDAATSAGCITGWDSQTFTGLGRFVTMIDDVEQQADGLATWWHMHVNGNDATAGIDDLSLGDGDRLEFVYQAAFF